MDSRTLELPDRAHRDALASVVGVLRRLKLSLEGFYIGAGTALTMRWRHRAPTGVWVFSPPHPLRSYNIEGYDLERLQKAIEAEGGEDPLPSDKWAEWRFQGVQVGIHASSPLSEHRSDQTEATTGLVMENSMSAFRKKLIGRISATGNLVPRDAVDMIEFHRREPETLRGLFRAYPYLRKPCAQECAFQAKAEPLEILKPLWTDMSDLFQGEPRGPFPRHDLASTLLAPQREENREEPPLLRVKLLPDEAFADPLFSERGSFDRKLLNYATPSMAGHPMSPDPEEIRDWFRAESIEDLPDNAESYMREFLKQVSGTRFFALRQGCGASLRDIARMTRWTDFLMSPALKAGINRLPRLWTTGSRAEEYTYQQLIAFRTPA